MSAWCARALGRVPRGVWLPLALLLAAEAVTRLARVESASLAPPSDVAAALLALLLDGSLIAATGQTVLATLGGLAVGGTIGLCAGLFLGLCRVADRLLEFTLEILRPVPPVALIPLALMLFGTGYRLETAIIAFGAVWPVLILSRSAIASIEPRLMELSRLLGLRASERVYKIIVPAISPQLFVAFRLAAAIALVLAVTVEITLNPIGLGNGIMLAGSALDPARMLAHLAWIGAVGFALNAFLLAIQQRLFGHVSRAGAFA